jgi:hypothetical protein
MRRNSRIGNKEFVLANGFSALYWKNNSGTYFFSSIFI